MHRRRFLRLAGVAALGALPSACTPREYELARLARPELLAAMGPDLVRAIGARYRATTPAERDADSIRDAILDSRSLGGSLLGREGVPELVRTDFAEGRTVVVDGWVLAKTEARQCALFSLLPA